MERLTGSKGEIINEELGPSGSDMFPLVLKIML